MVVAMQESVQDASKTGNALKTLSANMTGLTTSAKDGSVQLTKAGKTLENLAGIEVWDKQTGQVKDMYTVMDELYNKWGQFTEAEQKALGSTLAGKTQLNTFNALMSNWETARQLVDEYNQGLTIGSAEQENLRYLDSINGKWNQIKENMKGVANTLVTSDMAKGFLDGVVEATDVLNKSTKTTTDLLKDSVKGNLGDTFGDMIYGAFDGFKVNESWAKPFTKVFTSLSSVMGRGLEQVFNMSSVGQALKPLLEIMKISNKLGGDKELDNSIDERKSNINSIQSEISALKNQKESLDAVSEEYEKLSSKTKRSAQENQQLAQIRNQLAQTNPDMVVGYDQDGNAILKNAKLYNAELERQIKLKQQSQRVEENALASDAYERRLREQEEYNELLEKNNNMKLSSDLGKKEGLFGIGGETTKEYLKGLKERNEAITKENDETYQKSLEAYQQYLSDEMAMQEKHINQMESSNGFKKMAEDQKASMLSLMDSLDWSNFSLTEGSAITSQLEKIGDKVVSTTEQMGKHAEAINKLEEGYSSGKQSLMEYSDGLGKIFESAEKIDVESLSNWQSEMQNYINTTGDLAGASKMIDEMATSLERVTKIPKGTWSELLTLDPAPIDASNQALQRFLQTYNTSVDKIGKDGGTDKLVSQFETLQSSLQQLTVDGVSGEIDAEYLLNMKVNQPEPIQNLIDEIVKDGVDQETELPVLVNAMVDILNTGEISSDTINQIAELFDMEPQDVEMMLNVKTEVVGMDSLESEISSWNSLSSEEKELLLRQVAEGSEEIKISKQEWEGLSEEEKIQTLRQMLEGNGEVEQASQEFENAPEGSKDQTLSQKVEGKGELEQGNQEFENAKEGNKTQTLSQKVEGKGEIEKAKSDIESVPESKTTTITIKQAGANLLESISNWFKSNTKESVEISVQVRGQEAVNSVKSAVEALSNKDVAINVSGNATSQIAQIVSSLNGLQSKNISINASGNALSQINQIKSSLASLSSKVVSVSANVSGNEMVNQLKASISSLQGKAISVTCLTSGTPQVQALTSAINNVQGKTVSVTANVSGTDAVNALTSAINKVQSKSVTVSATTSGTTAVQNLASAIASVTSKSVTVSVTKKVTTVDGGTSTGKRSLPSSNNTTATMSNTPLANIPISASAGNQTSTITPLTNIPVSISADNDFGGTLDKGKILPSLDFNISHIKNLEEELKRLITTVETLDEKSDAVFGQERISLLQQQIPILKQQQKIQEQISNNEKAQNNELIYWLSQKGFAFDNMGNITNYNNKLLSMEKNVESLKERYDALNDVTGDNKNEEAIKSAKNAYESANETLSQTKDYLEEYFATNNEEITEATKKWWEYQNQITEVENEIRELLNLELNTRIDEISDSIDFLDAKIEGLNGTNRLQFLEEQNQLYREQQKLLHELAEQMRGQLSTINPLSEEYSEFASEIKGLSEKWWELEEALSDNLLEQFEVQTQKVRGEIEKLGNEIDFLDEKMEHYSGSEKIEFLENQTELYRQQQNALHELAETLRKQLTLMDKNSEEYLETESEIKGLSTEWWELESAIKDANEELKEVSMSDKLEPFKNSIQETEYLLDRCNDRLSLLEKKEGNNKNDRLGYLNSTIEILEEKLKATQDQFANIRALQSQVIEEAVNYGFAIDENGLISNYDELLNSLVGTDIYEKAKESADTYMELVREDLIEIQEEYQDTLNEIEKIQEEKMEITKDIEDEITNILEEEKEKRLNELEEYTDERISLLEKEKDAYKEMREERDYSESVDEKVAKITELQKQLDTASRDNTISGLKKQVELEKEIAEAQKELEEITQEKIDKDYEKNIDEQIEELRKQEESLKETIEGQFSEENVAKIVQKSLTDGFIELSGEVQSIQDLLLNSINSSADAYSVMGQVIKNELVSNLGVALSTMQNLKEIHDSLGLSDYSPINPSNITPLYGIESAKREANVSIGDTHINIQGGTSEELIEEFRNEIKKSQDNLISKISQGLN